MSAQIESIHFFRAGDTIRKLDGRTGIVDEAWTLYALVSWEDGTREEIDQFDPSVSVAVRATPDS